MMMLMRMKEKKRKGMKIAVGPFSSVSLKKKNLFFSIILHAYTPNIKF
jgi:hypothetical protein